MTPAAFMHNLKHNRVLHMTDFFVASTTAHIPYVDDEQRISVQHLGHGCYAVAMRVGFMEIPQVPRLLGLIEKHVPSWRHHPAETSYFLARHFIVPVADASPMPRWQKRLYSLLRRNAAHAAEYYSLPADRVVELGGQINL